MTRVRNRKNTNASDRSFAIRGGTTTYDLARFPEENPNPVMRISSEGVVVYSNRASLPLRQSWQHREGEPLAEQWQRYVREALGLGVNQQADVECQGRIFSVTFAPVLDADYVNVYGLDITDRKQAEEQIVNLAKFLSENPNPVLRIAKNGELLYANDASRAILSEWPCEPGQTVPEQWREILSDVFAGGEEQRVEEKYADRIFSFSVTPIGEGGYANIYGRDITDRKLVEEIMSESEQRFRDFFEKTPIGLHIFGPDQTITDINDAELDIIGYSREEIVGKKKWGDIVIPAQREKFQKHWQDIMTKGQVRDFEYTLVHKQGYHIDVSLNASSRFDENGNLINTRGSVLNITERKKAEEQRKVLLHDMGERVKELTCMYGVAMSIRQRTTLEEIFQDVVSLIPPGWEYTEITRGRICFEDQVFVSQPFELTEWKQVSDIVVSGGQHGSVEVYYLQERPKLDEGPFLAEERNLIDTVARMLSEAVEYFRAEGELKKYREHLEELVDERAAELKRANDELSQYAYAVSHDIRAPLRAIRNYADFLREDLDELLGIDQTEYLDALGEAVNEADALVTDLLELSRIDRAKDSFEKVDMGTLMAELKESLETGENTEIVMSEDWPVIEAPAILIRQIFTNLISNALRFNESAIRRAEVGCKSVAHDHYEFFVRDNGIGIAPEYHQRIFGLFERLHTSEEYEGTGIGLAIVKKAVGVLSGSIRVESRPGAGSTFYVTLPEKKKEQRK